MSGSDSLCSLAPLGCTSHRRPPKAREAMRGTAERPRPRWLMSGPARGLSRLSDLHVSPIPGRSGTRARAFESAAAPRGSCRQSTTSWRRQSTFSLHSERRRTRKCPQRWPSISNIADATRLTSDSLLAFLLHSPHPAFVRVIEGTLNVPNGARRIGIDGASEGHQRDCDCKSSGPKNHLVPYRICLPPEIKSHAFRTNSYTDTEFLAQFTHKTFFGPFPILDSSTNGMAASSSRNAGSSLLRKHWGEADWR